MAVIQIPTSHQPFFQPWPFEPTGAHFGFESLKPQWIRPRAY
jgi:hypothetical protein